MNLCAICVPSKEAGEAAVCVHLFSSWSGKKTKNKKNHHKQRLHISSFIGEHDLSLVISKLELVMHLIEDQCALSRVMLSHAHGLCLHLNAAEERCSL